MKTKAGSNPSKASTKKTSRKKKPKRACPPELQRYKNKADMKTKAGLPAGASA